MWAFIFITIAATMIFAIYCIIPNYWMRNRSKRVLRHGTAEKPWIALTFDDGPNPLYTPQLLDILKDAGIKATFFVMGKQALKHPYILERMHSEGHTIGCHSFSHRHAWLMSPWHTFKDLELTYQTIESFLGYKPRWYRPPWGMFNLCSAAAARKLDLKIAYWSIEAQDWEATTTAQHIYDTIISRAQPGSIIVLHDNRGAPGAPAKTLEALPPIIKALKKKGYTFVTLDQLKGDTT
ncbi:peptidoglycan/xylan/chitin deacetylase (PgdA/CDA1 family) [Caldicoprobacter guelmensis]|uniref:polysaccharide deacetylase family protein n=1 Tax=Caldicoprobacter guelmensis TaxID=1170224 RepID=UPI00195E1E59|nr:polysaccharide deacetylase family protein [Caldicoprobacter guelmensis]MBM7582577.1 peptidoglycan/xylan/chitin deacetylase (PgdA/CDA1 family) [Caldicoprobacter guelmensis]